MAADLDQHAPILPKQLAILAAAAFLPKPPRLQPSNPLKWHKKRFAIAEIAANFANYC